MNYLLRDALCSYNIGHLVPACEAAGIENIEVMMLLQEEKDIGEIAPKLGDRLKLKSLIKALIMENKSSKLSQALNNASTDSLERAEYDTVSIISDINESTEQCDIKHANLEYLTSQHSNITSRETTTDCTNMPSIAAVTSLNATSTLCESSVTNAKTTDTPTPCTLSVTGNVSAIALQSSTSNIEIVHPSAYGKNILTGIKEGQVAAILNASSLGKAILQSYKKKHTLNSNQQDAIVRIIIDQLVENSKSSLPSSVMFDVADELLHIFPSENRAVYITEITVGGRKRYCGKIYNRYRNHKQQLKKWLPNDSRSPEEHVLVVASTDTITSSEKKNLLWLKHHTGPWPEVCKLWKDTAKIRLSKNVSEGLAKLVSDFPALKHTLGSQLVRCHKFC